MKLKDFSHLLFNAIHEGVSKALMETSGLPLYISKADAYRTYGRSNVDRWVTEGLITPTTDRNKDSKNFIDRLKLDKVAASCNRITYLPVAERQR